jgi:hypothetical protein
MGSAHFRGVDIAVSILLKRFVIPSEYKPGEDDSWIIRGMFLQVCNVMFRVRRVPHDEQLVRSSHSLECLDDKVRIILGFEARDIQYITIWLDTPFTHRRIGTAFDVLRRGIIVDSAP